jgi:hypothetical protein
MLAAAYLPIIAFGAVRTIAANLGVRADTSCRQLCDDAEPHSERAVSAGGVGLVG